MSDNRWTSAFDRARLERIREAWESRGVIATDDISWLLFVLTGLADER